MKNLTFVSRTQEIHAHAPLVLDLVPALPVVVLLGVGLVPLGVGPVLLGVNLVLVLTLPGQVNIAVGQGADPKVDLAPALIEQTIENSCIKNFIWMFSTIGMTSIYFSIILYIAHFSMLYDDSMYILCFMMYCLRLLLFFLPFSAYYMYAYMHDI